MKGESNDLGGAVFKVSLPIATTPSNYKEKMKKILFIDDEKTLCKKVKQFLSKKGFAVTTTSNGKEGIRILKKEPFPLVITDMMMPGIDGLEVLNFVTENNPQSLTIILTGYGTMETVTEALRKNAYDYILKPFDCNHLLLTISKAFEILSLREAHAKAEEELKRLTITDDLTGLFNRRNFHTTLKSEINRTKRYNKPLSLMSIDLDNFKWYNDTYGHQGGDKILQTFSKTLKKNTREIDICYRNGGEEFAVILPETGTTEAVAVAERIRKSFQEITFCFKDGCNNPTTVYVTVSIGLAEYKQGYTINDFIRVSDEMLYRSKMTGRNTTSY